MWRMFSNAIRALFRSEMRQACKVAKAVFQREYPTLLYMGSSVRAQEEDRLVVAVFYQHPESKTKPSRYKIFGVSIDMENAKELECNPQSKYWIRGRR